MRYQFEYVPEIVAWRRQLVLKPPSRWQRILWGIASVVWRSREYVHYREALNTLEAVPFGDAPSDLRRTA